MRIIKKENQFGLQVYIKEEDSYLSIYFAGNYDKAKCKLTPLDEERYNKICDIFDYVVLETDGSRAMPI